MIFVRDKGRMCNNILQYGHLYAWGREHGRQTMSMRFAYKYQYFHICHTPYHHWGSYLFAKYGAKLGLIPVVSFNEPNADTSQQERLMSNKPLVIAEGWEARWYDLFLKYKAEILQLFAFDRRVKAYGDTLLDVQSSSDGCRLGLHIRRGDYRTFHGGRFYYSDEQYQRLIKQFVELHPKATIVICGNDPQLDESGFKEALPYTRLIFSKGNPGEDLYLLSQCDYLMGAPSTFTLVASMYRDLPLYWVKDADAPVTEASFDRFDHLFRHIL